MSAEKAQSYAEQICIIIFAELCEKLSGSLRLNFLCFLLTNLH